MRRKYLLDVSVLIALTEEDHVHRHTATKWFRTPGLDWGLCSFSEAGFLRISSNPKLGKLTMGEAGQLLKSFTSRVGYRFWPMLAGWISLDQRLRDRVFGHQQITDAYLLGLAIKEDGVLVTLDKGLRFLAGAEFSRHVLVLE
ncbi:MAG TPA: TA system VapC family ribonuclease toxin [Acidisarcina sp.]